MNTYMPVGLPPCPTAATAEGTRALPYLYAEKPDGKRTEKPVPAGAVL